jgi:ABC-2 type transport system ATP-binding protein
MSMVSPALHLNMDDARSPMHETDISEVAAIEFDRVTKHFGSTLALDDVSFRVPSGSIVGLLGPNGAGKSTAIRALLGHVRPDRGRATIRGRRLAEHGEPLRQVGAVAESVGLDPALSPRRLLELVCRGAGIDQGRVDEVLGLTGAEEFAAKRIRDLSTGMRQRTALAVALVGDPGCLVLDEPLNGLDPDGIRWLRRMLRATAGRGCAVLLSSHLLAEVAQTVDRVVVLYRHTLFDGPLADLGGGGDLEDAYFGLVDGARRRRAGGLTRVDGGGAQR